jgi:hypothetical protein
MTEDNLDVEVSIDDLLEERGKTHGKFSDSARCAQRLKAVVRDELKRRHERTQPPLEFTHMESIDMILYKIGRIIAGDATFADHWNDIAGYGKLPNKEV